MNYTLAIGALLLASSLPTMCCLRKLVNLDHTDITQVRYIKPSTLTKYVNRLGYTAYQADYRNGCNFGTIHASADADGNVLSAHFTNIEKYAAYWWDAEHAQHVFQILAAIWKQKRSS